MKNESALWKTVTLLCGHDDQLRFRGSGGDNGIVWMGCGRYERSRGGDVM